MLVGGQVGVKSCLILAVLLVGGISSTSPRRLSSVHSQSLRIWSTIQFPRQRAIWPISSRKVLLIHLSLPTPVIQQPHPQSYISHFKIILWDVEEITTNSIMETSVLLKMFGTWKSKEREDKGCRIGLQYWWLSWDTSCFPSCPFINIKRVTAKRWPNSWKEFLGSASYLLAPITFFSNWVFAQQYPF
jgi:hypothetical protein